MYMAMRYINACSAVYWLYYFIAEEKSMLQEDMPVPEHPEVVVFASYSGPPKYPVRISVLGEMVGVCMVYLFRHCHSKQLTSTSFFHNLMDNFTFGGFEHYVV